MALTEIALYLSSYAIALLLSRYFIREIENQEQAKPAKFVWIALVSLLLFSICVAAHRYSATSALFLPALAIASALATVDCFTTLMPLRLQLATLAAALIAAVSNFTVIEWLDRGWAALVIVLFYGSLHALATIQGKAFSMGFGDYIFLPALLLLTNFSQPYEIIIGIGVYAGLFQLINYIARYKFLFSPMTENATTAGAAPFAPSLLLGTQVLAFGVFL